MSKNGALARSRATACAPWHRGAGLGPGWLVQDRAGFPVDRAFDECTNHGAAMRRGAANNCLVITPSHRRLVNPSSQDGGANASTVVVVSLWSCRRRGAHRVEGPSSRPQLHNPAAVVLPYSRPAVRRLGFDLQPLRHADQADSDSFENTAAHGTTPSRLSRAVLDRVWLRNVPLRRRL
jgi:hypothetical protein